MQSTTQQITDRLVGALASMDEHPDGIFTTERAGIAEHNHDIIITYTPHDIDARPGTCRITLRKEYTGDWHRKPTGKIRLVVEGKYRGPSALQYPQRKDGTHSYDKAIATATDRAYNESVDATHRTVQEAATRRASDAMVEVIKANNVPVGKGILRSRANGIRLTLSGLSKGDADIMIKAAKAAGIELK